LPLVDEQVIGRNFGPLEAPGTGIAEVRAVLEFHGSANEGPAWDRGCTLCNSAVEFGPHDPSGAGFVERYFQRAGSPYQVGVLAHSC